MESFFLSTLSCWYFSLLLFANSANAFQQNEENDYLARFDQIMAKSYSQVDDDGDGNLNKPPKELIDECQHRGAAGNLTNEIVVTTTDPSGVISASSVQSQCGSDTICILPFGLELQMDGNLNVGALIVRGSLEWTSSTQESDDQFLCGGFIVVEENGSFTMDLDEGRNGWIYVKNNGAEHPQLQSRSFGTYKERNSSNNTTPTMVIRGRQTLKRTWTLLSQALTKDAETMRVLHDPIEMGWRVGDRLGIAPTEPLAKGWGQVVRIVHIDEYTGAITLDEPIDHAYRADFHASETTKFAALLSAEVINLSRNIIITGDDFEHVPCTHDLPEAVAGEQTSVKGCRCAGYRSTCTVGLHTMQKHGGVTRIENTRVEKCGQRGIEGKYCLHFHKMQDCPECVFRGNAIENSQQRGIIVHGTHNTLVEDNVLYNVRGGNIYLEDGNEMWNTLAYNVAVCPFPFRNTTYRGCTVPGTSNSQADTSANQAGFYSNGASTNNFIGNRAANHFNGMFLDSGEMGRGEANGKVCESSSRLGRFDGNTWHGNGRFGTYALGRNYPQQTDQSVANNGYNGDKDLCETFDVDGRTHGLPGSFANHVDYGNDFVGFYSAGDIQFNGHHSVQNIHSIYWKETKNFQNGCGSHIINGYYSEAFLYLPDQSTFIIDNAFIGDDVLLMANHHCNVGVTGFLCMPQYILHDVKWKNKNRNKQWVKFQDENVQGHTANQNHGGIFALSPPEAAIVKAGGTVENSFFPEGYVSLVSNKFQYLLETPDNVCVDSTAAHGNLYNNGILCKTELRALKIYTRGLLPHTAAQLKISVWFKPNGDQSGSPDSSQLIGFHQIGNDNETRKQGYSVPVIPGIDHSYRLALSVDDANLPEEWVIEFSDPVIGNRWSEEEIILTVAGRECGNGGRISSQHDRKFIWGGNRGILDDRVWSYHGACVGAGPFFQPLDEFPVDCTLSTNSARGSETEESFAGIIEPTHCPEKCNADCSSNSYCDCGSESCECKAGYTGTNCEIDLCSSALCSDNGFCSARYLGGAMPVSEKACICKENWLGERCDHNPCFEMDIDCGSGTCIALSETEATCKCPDGYFGANCEEQSQCNLVCKGTFPYFGCAADVSGKSKLGCDAMGGCSYVDEGSDYPYGGFCTYKSYESNVIFKTPGSSSIPSPTPSISTSPSTPSDFPSHLPSHSPSISISPSTPSDFPSHLPSHSPTIPSPTEDSNCSAHPKCEALSGDCCPTTGGVRLACCSDPNGNDPGRSCSVHPACSHLEGDCCPTNDGTELACCNMAPIDSPTTCSDATSRRDCMNIVGCKWMNKVCFELLSCDSILEQKQCNRNDGCIWVKTACEEALPHEQCQQFSKGSICRESGCIWNRDSKDCRGKWDDPGVGDIPILNCDDGTRKGMCNAMEGCSWRKETCQKALSSERCARFESRMNACKRNGCLFNRNNERCRGRWD